MKTSAKVLVRLTAVGLTAALALTACGGGADPASTGSSTGTFAKDSDTLVMGMVPDEGQATSTYQPLADYVQKVTGKKVEVKQSTNYAALIEASIAGQVDVISFSAFTYLQAKAKGAAITPVGATITEKGTGKPGYYSTAIVPAGSDIKDVAGFKGKKVCFVSESSTSGYLFPQYMLKKAGIDTKTEITPVMAGSHDVSAQKVAKGAECDAGFAQEITVTTTGPAAGLFKADDLKIVDKSLVPGPPFAIADALPADLKKTLTEKISTVTVKDITDAGIASNPAFDKFFGDGNAPVDDAYYNDLRDFCRKLPEVKTCAGI
ncbi:MAG: phosphate/phosphite/phosphonate ABC transporter substrate-binding protein [Renibacterium salmoninarum]|nr:phosphate/phosphite/phosphonate ABC transporter substrate-binding protein [Renibacterium sp.]MDN5668475.1 phosphate/phosphite/phosphonate ABC transporter substrate-binding protein [Renibacterium salmoninarum]